jgi:hypothetical protein
MSVWVLVFYMGSWASAQGGPAVIDGISDKSACERMAKEIREGVGHHYNVKTHKCVEKPAAKGGDNG